MSADDNGTLTLSTGPTSATETGHAPAATPVDPARPVGSTTADGFASTATSAGPARPLSAPVAALTLPRRYTRPELLGRGGMGEVWRVYDCDLHRAVAMKLIRPGLDRRGQMVQRFREEAQVTAQLEHPGIVPVYDVGELADGRIFYTMKEIVGRTMAHAIKHTNGLETRLLLVDVLVDVCDAVGYAHGRGVLHRDLKPANVIIGEFGETLVLDWGLSKLIDAEDDGTAGGSPEPAVRSDRAADPAMQTRHGRVSGTRGFMAPEQRRGQTDRIGPWTDVYALGAILYQLLTGGYPPDEPDVDALTGPEALVALCREALSAAPADRPADGSAFGGRLTGWLTGHRHRERTRRWQEDAEALAAEVPAVRELALRGLDVRGRPRAIATDGLEGAGLGPAVARAVDGGLLVAGADGRLAFAEPEQAARWPLLAAWRSADGPLRPQLGDASTQWQTGGRRRHLLWRDERQAELAAWVERVEPRLTPVERAFVEASADAERRAGRRRRRLQGGGVLAAAAVIAVLAVLLWQAVTARDTADRALGVADEARAAEEEMRGVARSRTLLAASRGSRASGRPFAELAYARAALDGADADTRSDLEAVIARLQTRAGTSRMLAQASSGVTSLALTPDGRLVVTGLADGTVQVHALEDGARLLSKRVHQNRVHHISISPDGARAVTCSDDRRARLWDLRSMSPRAELDMADVPSMRSTFSPDSERVVTSGMNHRLVIWRAADGTRVGEIDHHKGGHEMAFSADGRRFVTAAWWGGPLRFYDGDLGTLVAEDRLGVDPSGLRFAPDARRVLVMGWGAAAVHDSTDGTPHFRLGDLDDAAQVLDGAFTPYGELVVRQDGVISVHDASSGTRIRALNPVRRNASTLVLSPDGQWAAVGDIDGRLGLYSTRTWHAVDEVEVRDRGLSHVRFTADGKGLVVGADDGALVLLRPALMNHRLLRCDGEPASVAATARGSAAFVAQAPDEPVACLVSPDAPAIQHPLHPGERAMGIDPAARNLVVSHPERGLRVLDARTGRERGRIPGISRADVRFDALTGRIVLAAQRETTGEHYRIEAWSPTGRRLDGRALNIKDGVFRRLISARWLLVSDVASKGTSIRDPVTGDVRSSLPAGPPGSRLRAYDAVPGAGRVAELWTSGTVRVFDTEGGVIFHRRLHSTMDGSRVALSSDGRIVAVGADAGRVVVYRVEDGRQILDAPSTGRTVRRMAFASGGRSLAVATASEVRVWSLDDARLIRWIPLLSDAPALFFVGQRHLVLGRDLDTRLVELGPPPDPATLTNLRVCPDDLTLTAITPYGPDALTPGPSAPAAACADR